METEEAPAADSQEMAIPSVVLLVAMVEEATEEIPVVAVLVETVGILEETEEAQMVDPEEMATTVDLAEMEDLLLLLLLLLEEILTIGPMSFDTCWT